MTTFQISTSPEYYGSDASQDDAERAAWIIAERVASEYPEADIEIVSGSTSRDAYDEAQAEIQQWVNDHWTDWM